MRYKESMFKSLRGVRDILVKIAKRFVSASACHPPYEFNVELLDGDKIAFNECEGVIRGEHENLSRTIEIAKIDAVGYMTYEADPWFYDFLFIFNSEGVTYMMPTEWPHAHEVVDYLEKTLQGYNNRIGLANSIHYATLAVWPPSIAGGKFPLMDTVFPPIFYPREEEMDSEAYQKGLPLGRRQ